MLASWCYLYTPLISHNYVEVTICSRHVMASVRDIQIAEAFLTLCLAYETSSTLLKSSFHVSRYGACVSRVYSPYFPQWLDGLQRYFFMLFFLILLCNRQNIVEYEAYWLTINNAMCASNNDDAPPRTVDIHAVATNAALPHLPQCRYCIHCCG